ncbi:MAG: hypothetical protein DSY42_07170 [Aquifex sp.]|nr:MAG: hypothetical protein DSY42_07170 [Aquifex sp.]
MKRILIPNTWDWYEGFEIDVGSAFYEEYETHSPGVDMRIYTCRMDIDLDLNEVTRKAIEVIKQKGYRQYIQRYPMNVGNFSFRSYIGVEELPFLLGAGITFFKERTQEGVYNVVASVSIKPILTKEEAIRFARWCAYDIATWHGRVQCGDIFFAGNGTSYSTFLPLVEGVYTYFSQPGVYIAGNGFWLELIPNDAMVIGTSGDGRVSATTYYKMAWTEGGVEESVDTFAGYKIPKNDDPENVEISGEIKLIDAPSEFPIFIPDFLWDYFSEKYDEYREETRQQIERTVNSLLQDGFQVI